MYIVNKYSGYYIFVHNLQLIIVKYNYDLCMDRLLVFRLIRDKNLYPVAEGSPPRELINIVASTLK